MLCGEPRECQRRESRHVSRTSTRTRFPAAGRLQHGELLLIIAGFADCGQPTNSLPPSRTARSADTPSAAADSPAKRYASADDRIPRRDDSIPKGTFEKAPAGALADRDYGNTQLDPDKARELINAYRKEKGLKPLKLNTALTEAAKAHSRDLAKWDRISHYGSDGSNPWDRVKRAGYNAKVAAENVGTGQATIDEVMKGWQASPGHNKNLLLARRAAHGHRPGAGPAHRVQDLLDAGGRIVAVAVGWVSAGTSVRSMLAIDPRVTHRAAG